MKNTLFFNRSAGHFIEKCKVCNTTVSQCRCPSDQFIKTVRFVERCSQCIKDGKNV